MNLEIKAGNKLFAEFLGWEFMEGKETFTVPNLFPTYNLGDEENTGWIAEDIEDLMFAEDWGWIMAVYEKIIALDNGRWDIEIKYSNITIVDYKFGEQRYEWKRTGDTYDEEESMITLLFHALAFYIGRGLFKID
jgi:hypothetical protein